MSQHIHREVLFLVRDFCFFPLELESHGLRGERHFWRFHQEAIRLQLPLRREWTRTPWRFSRNSTILSFQTKTDQLAATFAEFGAVKDVYLQKIKGGPKSFAFVTFEEENGAEA